MFSKPLHIMVIDDENTIISLFDDFMNQLGWQTAEKLNPTSQTIYAGFRK